MKLYYYIFEDKVNLWYVPDWYSCDIRAIIRDSVEFKKLILQLGIGDLIELEKIRDHLSANIEVGNTPFDKRKIRINFETTIKKKLGLIEILEQNKFSEIPEKFHSFI